MKTNKLVKLGVATFAVTTLGLAATATTVHADTNASDQPNTASKPPKLGDWLKTDEILGIKPATPPASPVEKPAEEVSKPAEDTETHSVLDKPGAPTNEIFANGTVEADAEAARRAEIKAKYDVDPTNKEPDESLPMLTPEPLEISEKEKKQQEILAVAGVASTYKEYDAIISEENRKDMLSRGIDITEPPYANTDPEGPATVDISLHSPSYVAYARYMDAEKVKEFGYTTRAQIPDTNPDRYHYSNGDSYDGYSRNRGFEKEIRTKWEYDPKPRERGDYIKELVAPEIMGYTFSHVEKERNLPDMSPDPRVVRLDYEAAYYVNGPAYSNGYSKELIYYFIYTKDEIAKEIPNPEETNTKPAENPAPNEVSKPAEQPAPKPAETPQPAADPAPASKPAETPQPEVKPSEEVKPEVKPSEQPKPELKPQEEPKVSENPTIFHVHYWVYDRNNSSRTDIVPFETISIPVGGEVTITDKVFEGYKPMGIGEKVMTLKHGEKIFDGNLDDEINNVGFLYEKDPNFKPADTPKPEVKPAEKPAEEPSVTPVNPVNPVVPVIPTVPTSPTTPVTPTNPATPSTNRILSNETGSVRVQGTEATLKDVSYIKVEETKANLLEATSYKAYDIHLYDANGKAIQPKGMVLVTLSADKPVENVYYVAPDGALESLAFKQDADKVTFETNHFSIYAMTFKNIAANRNNGGTPTTVSVLGGQTTPTSSTTQGGTGGNTAETKQPQALASKTEAEKVSKTAAAKTLPNTGENHSILATLFGFLALFAGLFTFRKKAK